MVFKFRREYDFVPCDKLATHLWHKLLCVHQANTNWFFFLCSSNLEKIQNITQHYRITAWTKVQQKILISDGTMTSPHLILNYDNHVICDSNSVIQFWSWNVLVNYTATIRASNDVIWWKFYEIFAWSEL